ncbi:MAG: hypothetical protein AB202_00225 [Parcubacteria bacterium C7867-007]|nr:MAG: hypothetical protein AB202_00225 [Parcubacteria bacterium C7867-007]
MFPHPESHTGSVASLQNWLRAAVLGANDGIVSLAALVVGIAATSASTQTLLVTGVAALVAGALSMAVGEYVSVSSQRDIEHALLAKERYELEHYADEELAELIGIYEKKGLSHETARTVALELTAHDAFAAHVDAELGIDPDDLTDPLQAAFASAAAFSLGAVIPLIAIVTAPVDIRVQVTFVAVLIALVGTGLISAKMSGAGTRMVIVRMIFGGLLAMVITFGIGRLFGAGF